MFAIEVSGAVPQSSTCTLYLIVSRLFSNSTRYLPLTSLAAGSKAYDRHIRHNHPRLKSYHQEETPDDARH
jgi:hypothetical protein